MLKSIRHACRRYLSFNAKMLLAQALFCCQFLSQQQIIGEYLFRIILAWAPFIVGNFPLKSTKPTDFPPYGRKLANINFVTCNYILQTLREHYLLPNGIVYIVYYLDTILESPWNQILFQHWHTHPLRKRYEKHAPYNGMYNPTYIPWNDDGDDLTTETKCTT